LDRRTRLDLPSSDRVALFNDTLGENWLRGDCSALRRNAALCTLSPQNHSDFERFLRLGRTLNLRVVGSIPTRLTIAP
jgi:hypothetical protein